MRKLYIETVIQTEMDLLWERTQDPAQHQRWDVRFTDIDYLPLEPGQPQHFRYANKVLPWRPIAGTGISAGERDRADGTRVSALRFRSSDPLSIIEEGSGYWRYVPTDAGIRFATGYDYRVRWGRFGRLADHLFRPLMGWGTAWSFDRLRLWCEADISPRRSLGYAVADAAARTTAIVTSIALLVFSLSSGWIAALALIAAAVLLPPTRHTPAARRCLRRPPARTTAPTLLTALEATS
ncbi:hypothetical protein JK358_22115 [Nocardia sp. 2]|uniref:Membrane protein YndG n=1 Tax=Nocardia acididurans TaxID=2802282 RepID=A0ABS1M8X6_9NOCA|nr:hypothetical protein [Nocardia acididurans]MBL1077098.1 hypothetical protein [Nocardia acididurans]